MFVVLVWGVVLWKTIDLDMFYKRNITMKVFLKDDLETDNMSVMIRKILDSKGKEYRHSLKVDRIDFFVNKSVFNHIHIRSVSKLNLKKEFFVDFEIPLMILKEGFYKISLTTNQASYLYIDGKELASLKETKNLEEKDITVFMEEGYHNVKLLYFQMPGAKGLKLSYVPSGSNKNYLFGQNSEYVSF